MKNINNRYEIRFQINLKFVSELWRNLNENSFKWRTLINTRLVNIDISNCKSIFCKNIPIFKSWILLKFSKIENHDAIIDLIINSEYIKLWNKSVREWIKLEDIDTNFTIIHTSYSPSVLYGHNDLFEK